MQRYDRKKPFVNRQILLDLKTMNEKQDVESTKKFIENLFGGRFLCAMLSRGQSKTSEAFSPYVLTTEDDDYVFPIFTNELEVLKGNDEFEDYTIYSVDFNDILGIYAVINKQIPISLAIDPYGVNYSLTESMINIAKETIEKLKD